MGWHGVRCGVGGEAYVLPYFCYAFQGGKDEGAKRSSPLLALQDKKLVARCVQGYTILLACLSVCLVVLLSVVCR